MKKLYVTDLDGTLLNQSACISPYSEQVLKDLIEQGIHFTIATGRSPFSAFSIMQNIPLNAPVILMNGAAIYDLKGQKCLSSVPVCTSSFHNILAAENKADIKGGYILSADDTFKGFICTTPTQKFYTYLNSYDFPLISSNLSCQEENSLLYALYADSANTRLELMYNLLKHDSNIICDFY